MQVVEAPCQPMRGGLLSGVKAYAEERPVNISKAGDRRFILDFGTNNTGRICLPKVTIAPGDTVCVRYAETLKDNGKELYTANLRSAENTDYFVGNGSPVTMTTEFLWHGFRYMEVTGLDEQDVRRLQRQLMTDDLLSSAAISIDEGDGMINRILANARRGILSNYKGMPMDCPQRDERMPWLGDLIPWAYECVAGIAPDPAKPGFKHIVMRPDFSIKDVRGARATYPSLYGDISSHWWRKDQKVFWQVTIPANTTATLYLPDGKTINVGSGSYTYKVED